MLTIRKEQMKAFEAHLSKRFRSRLRRHLREDLGVESKDLSDNDLEELINQALERGRGYGVTSEREVSLFLDLMVLKGADFDRDPTLLWARKILVNNDLDGATKMQAIYGRLAALEDRKAMPEAPQ